MHVQRGTPCSRLPSGICARAKSAEDPQTTPVPHHGRRQGNCRRQIRKFAAGNRWADAELHALEQNLFPGIERPKTRFDRLLLSNGRSYSSFFEGSATGDAPLSQWHQAAKLFSKRSARIDSRLDPQSSCPLCGTRQRHGLCDDKRPTSLAHTTYFS